MQSIRLRVGQLLAENLPFPTSTSISILDWCCGDGEVSSLIWEHLPFAQVFGGDFDPSVIDLARQKFPHLKENFFVFPPSFPEGWEGRYDCIVSAINLDEFPNPKAILSQMLKVASRWVIVTARANILDEAWWRKWTLKAYKELTTEPNDGIRWIAVLDKQEKIEPISNPKVLISSPIRQDAGILQPFLLSLSELDVSGIDISYLFVDNNDDSSSSNLMHHFKQHTKNTVEIWRVSPTEKYNRDEKTHFWTENLIWRLAGIKDKIFEFAFENDFDFVWLLDSDLIVHPKTLKRLMSHRCDIACAVFWTKWKPNSPILPQVWLHDYYEMHKLHHHEELSNEEIVRRSEAFINALWQSPGLYRVHGLGACTLFSRRAIKQGVRFSEVQGLSLMGEDRHLCVRAESLGIPLFADTTLPPFHIYRKQDLVKVPFYKRLCQRPFTPREFINSVISLTEADIPQFVKVDRCEEKEEVHYVIS